jgi:hypothetical protein
MEIMAFQIKDKANPKSHHIINKTIIVFCFAHKTLFRKFAKEKKYEKSYLET